MTNTERFDNLAEKLLSTRRSDDGKYEQTLMKEAILRDKLRSIIVTHIRTINQLKSEAKDIAHLARENTRQSKQMQELETKELEAMTARVHDRLNSESGERRDSQRRIMDFLGSKLSHVKQQIVNESRSRQTQLEEMASSLQNDMPSLMDMIKLEAEKTENSGAQIAEDALQKLDELTALVVQERKLVQKSQYTMLQLTKQLINKTQKQMQEQQRSRETNHDKIIEMIDEACNKLMGTRR